MIALMFIGATAVATNKETEATTNILVLAPAQIQTPAPAKKKKEAGDSPVEQIQKVRGLAKDVVSDINDIHGWVKKLSDQDPWQQRTRQVEISIINKTLNKTLEVKQIRGKKHKPMHMNYGEQIYAITTEDGKSSAAAPNATLKGFFASSQEATSLTQNSNLQGVSGSMMISVTDSAEPEPESTGSAAPRKRFYLNIAFENAVTARSGVTGSLQAFDISISKSKGAPDESAARQLFDDMTDGESTDMNRCPVQVGNEWFVLKAYKKPVTGDNLKNAVHYEFTIEQVSEDDTVEDVEEYRADNCYEEASALEQFQRYIAPGGKQHDKGSQEGPDMTMQEAWYASCKVGGSDVYTSIY